MNRVSVVAGTRGSALALAQMELLREALREARVAAELEVRKITTTGDGKVDLSLARATPAGAKGLFTREIEEALLSGMIDVAVHSLKDLPGVMSEGLLLAAVLPRAKSGDVLLTRRPGGLEGLPTGGVIGTSSVRRERQLQRLRPDLRIVELRGNVPTRLRKLEEQPELDGIVLAEAGLERLGYFAEPARIGALHWVSLADRLLPAIGQGVIAMQVRAGDDAMFSLLEPVRHEPTWICARAERELLRLLNGDCRLPVGARTMLEGRRLKMEALVFDLPDGAAREGCIEGDASDPEELAGRLHRQLYGED